MIACPMISGGKDSVYALHWAILHGFNLCCAIAIEPETRWESTLFHYPHIRMVELQARALRIRLIKSLATRNEESSLMKTFSKVKALGCDAVITGALLSDYQRLRFASIAEEVGLRIFNPLWRINQEEYMRSIVREGFKVMIVSVQAYGLPSWIVGKILDTELVETIIKLSRRYGFNPAFEGGEAETLVLDAPLFREELRVEGQVVRLGPDHYFYEIRSARLVPKTYPRERS